MPDFFDTPYAPKAMTLDQLFAARPVLGVSVTGFVILPKRADAKARNRIHHSIGVMPIRVRRSGIDQRRNCIGSPVV